MDTWGVDSFENDDAKAWAQAYREMGLFVAKSTMEVALGDFQAGGGVSADVARRAIAAVEAVGHAVGRGSPAAAEAFADAPAADPSEAEALVPMTEDVLGAIRNGSELATIWGETPQNGDWLAVLDALGARVAGAPQPVSQPEAAAPVPEVAVKDMGSDDLRAMVVQLSSDLQTLREEMHDGMNGLARMIGARTR